MRVKDLVPEAVRSRYVSVNDSEPILVRERTTILTCFLHISPECRLETFRERLELPLSQIQHLAESRQRSPCLILPCQLVAFVDVGQGYSGSAAGGLSRVGVATRADLRVSVFLWRSKPQRQVPAGLVF